MVEAAVILRMWLDEAGSKGYEQLARLATAGQEDRAQVRGGTGAKYQLEILYMWDSRPGGAVRVMACIDDGGLRAFAPLTKGVRVWPPAQGGD